MQDDNKQTSQEPLKALPATIPAASTDTPSTTKNAGNSNSGRGGKRDGAGRPMGAKNKTTLEHREYIQAKLSERLDDIIEAGINLALGKISVIEGYEKDGKTPIVYEIAPDKQAWYKILELLGGRPTQPLEHSGQINNPAIEQTYEIMRKILESKKNAK